MLSSRLWKQSRGVAQRWASSSAFSDVSFYGKGRPVDAAGEIVPLPEVQEAMRNATRKPSQVKKIHLVDSAKALAAVKDLVPRGVPIAIDTEFVNLQGYRPKLELLQLATRENCLLIDPRNFTSGELHEFFSPLCYHNLFVLHSADQDLEMIFRCCDSTPRQIFDTQIAAGLAGIHDNAISLARLTSFVLDKEMDKSETLSNWSMRPFTEKQLSYAAGDVLDLLEMKDVLIEAVRVVGREDWMDIEHERVLREVGKTQANWLSMKRLHSLSPRELHVLRQLYHIRDSQAQLLNMLPTLVASDDLLRTLAKAHPQSNPDSLEGFQGASGFISSNRVSISTALQNSLSISESNLPPLPPHKQLMSSASESLVLRARLEVNIAATEHRISRSLLLPDYHSLPELLFMPLNQLEKEFSRFPVMLDWRYPIIGKRLLELRNAFEREQEMMRVAYNDERREFLLSKWDSPPHSLLPPQQTAPSPSATTAAADDATATSETDPSVPAEGQSMLKTIFNAEMLKRQQAHDAAVANTQQAATPESPSTSSPLKREIPVPPPRHLPPPPKHPQQPSSPQPPAAITDFLLAGDASNHLAFPFLDKSPITSSQFGTQPAGNITNSNGYAFNYQNNNIARVPSSYQGNSPLRSPHPHFPRSSRYPPYPSFPPLPSSSSSSPEYRSPHPVSSYPPKNHTRASPPYKRPSTPHSPRSIISPIATPQRSFPSAPPHPSIPKPTAVSSVSAPRQPIVDILADNEGASAKTPKPLPTTTTTASTSASPVTAASTTTTLPPLSFAPPALSSTTSPTPSPSSSTKPDPSTEPDAKPKRGRKKTSVRATETPEEAKERKMAKRELKKLAKKKELLISEQPPAKPEETPEPKADSEEK